MQGYEDLFKSGVRAKSTQTFRAMGVQAVIEPSPQLVDRITAPDVRRDGFVALHDSYVHSLARVEAIKSMVKNGSAPRRELEASEYASENLREQVLAYPAAEAEAEIRAIDAVYWGTEKPVTHAEAIETMDNIQTATPIAPLSRITITVEAGDILRFDQEEDGVIFIQMETVAGETMGVGISEGDIAYFDPDDFEPVKPTPTPDM